MDNRRDNGAPDFDPALNPLKTLTPAQFAALGGTAVVFVRSIGGEALSRMVRSNEIDEAGSYQLVMSADGSPLFVTDTADSVTEWLSDKNFGLVTLH